MNRIYQGKVTVGEIGDAKDDDAGTHQGEKLIVECPPIWLTGCLSQKLNQCYQRNSDSKKHGKHSGLGECNCLTQFL